MPRLRDDLLAMDESTTSKLSRRVASPPGVRVSISESRSPVPGGRDRRFGNAFCVLGERKRESRTARSRFHSRDHGRVRTARSRRAEAGKMDRAALRAGGARPRALDSRVGGAPSFDARGAPLGCDLGRIRRGAERIAHRGCICGLAPFAVARGTSDGGGGSVVDRRMIRRDELRVRRRAPHISGRGASGRSSAGRFLFAPGARCGTGDLVGAEGRGSAGHRE